MLYPDQIHTAIYSWSSCQTHDGKRCHPSRPFMSFDKESVAHIRTSIHWTYRFIELFRFRNCTYRVNGMPPGNQPKNSAACIHGMLVNIDSVNYVVDWTNVPLHEYRHYAARADVQPLMTSAIVLLGSSASLPAGLRPNLLHRCHVDLVSNHICRPSRSHNAYAVWWYWMSLFAT